MPGEFQITSTEHWPTWHVPASIQREMARLRQPVRKRVAPGPKNPLGEYWLGLSGSGCGIHGTNVPASIYRFLTHGCIRLHPDDLADFVGQVGIGTAVRIDYEPVLLCALDGGAVFLEIHPDVYCLAPDPRAAIGGLAARLGVAGRLDPGRVAQALELREGRARRVDALPLGASGTASPASGAPAPLRRVRSTIPD
jgi:L,D-transpeptidase ErfK/SrfK